jgi:hypothetical protein
MIQGEIDVERFMDWAARQRRMTEWEALRWFWKACREQDSEGKQRVRELYGKRLDDALNKYYQR